MTPHMNRRQESRRAADRRRADKPSRKWLNSSRWKARRKQQLDRVPWCETCRAAGRSRIATVANHNPPHNENERAFFEGPLESVCKDCHDSPIQRAEGEGFRRDVDADGWPADPNHPFNRSARR
jgi:5-methylcytosine-specific restriction enzyme A